MLEKRVKCTVKFNKDSKVMNEIIKVLSEVTGYLSRSKNKNITKSFHYDIHYILVYINFLTYAVIDLSFDI